ncbi:unnamed protein product [Gadus morhua 'NCC']
MEEGSKPNHFEMKSILKKKNLKGENSTQSSSIGAVRWPQNEMYVQQHSSAPSQKTSTPAQNPRQNGLKDLRSLQDCVEFINDWKAQVDHVCQQGSGRPEDGGAGSTADEGRVERSLEQSRQLILEWAGELRHIDALLRDTPAPTPTETRAEEEEEEEEEEGPKEETQMRIMRWAKELQDASVICGIEREELGQMLRLLGQRKRKLVHLLPLLEFITWSLLKEDRTKMMAQFWLLAKQRSWEAGVARYIPNSVWSWITSATADVTLDPMTNNPWLQISEDQRGVQEGPAQAPDLPYSPQRFTGWPGVTGWEGYGRGRHYWQVDIANTGVWRVGVTAVDAKRRGRVPMSPRRGYWALWRSAQQFYACTEPEPTPLPLAMAPRHLGVYLDYEEGQVSFYNAKTQTHIFTFTGSFRGKMYPLLAPLDGRTRLEVRPPPPPPPQLPRRGSVLGELK